MRARDHFWLLIVVLWLLGWAGALSAAPVYWTDWTAANPGAPETVIGGIALPSGGPVGVTYSGDYTAVRTGGGTLNFWSSGSSYTDGLVVGNGPTLPDIIVLSGTGGVTHTLTFSQPVVNPSLAIASLGWRPAARYDFSADATVIAGGPAVLGDGRLLGLLSRVVNANGRTLRFEGTFSEIQWTMSGGAWQGFTVGIDGIVAGSDRGDSGTLDLGGTTLAVTHAPAPGALLLGGLGAGLLAWLRRRRML